MNFEEIDEKNKEIYNLSVGHPLQTFEWGEFRKKTGVDVLRSIALLLPFVDQSHLHGGTQTLRDGPNNDALHDSVPAAGHLGADAGRSARVI